MTNSAKQPWSSKLASLRRIPEIAMELWRASGSLMIVSISLRLALATFPPLILWASKMLIDALVHIQTSPGVMWSRVWEFFALELGLIVSSDVLGRTANYSDVRMSDLFAHRLNVRILEHSNKLDLEDLESPVFQDQLERARSQISTQLGVLFSLAQIFQNSIGLVALIAAVALYAPWLVVLQVGALLPLASMEMYFASAAHRLRRERTPLRRNMDYLMNLSTTATSVKEIKAFQLGPHFAREFDTLGEQFQHENASLSKRRNAFGAVLATIGSVAYYAGYGYLVWQTGHAKITIGTLFFLGASFQRSKLQVQDILATLSRTLDQTLHLGDVFEFFRSTPRIRPVGERQQTPQTISKGFEFRNVSFGYAGSSSNALDRVSFVIEPGETIALVGENGAGKTTLTKLLARLYEPTEGSILLDGVNIRDYDQESYQRQVSVVFQDFVRYEMTAGVNIGFGDLSSRDDQAKIDAAAKAGLAWPIIARLPSRYQQLLGKRFEGGMEISGGEWQKFALSRACMRGAQLLILDEPSASLDAMNEFLLIEHFAKLTAGKMAVLISHRLPAVRMAHKILVLSHGRLIEEGTHEELIASGGEYASMFHLQASGYNDEFRFSRTNGSTPCP